MLKEKREEYININLTNLRQIFGGGSQQEREKGKVRKLLNRKAMR